MPLGPAPHEREGYDALRRQNEGFIKYWQFWVFGIGVLLFGLPLLVMYLSAVAFDHLLTYTEAWGICAVGVILLVIVGIVQDTRGQRRRAAEDTATWLREHPQS